MKIKLIYVLLLILLVVAWEHFGTSNQTVRLLVSAPSLVLDYFYTNYAELLEATGTTLIEAIAGLSIATAFSFGVMILCFYRPGLMEFVLPIMVTSQVIPLIVLAPFFIILLGLGLASKIAMAAVMCFFPIFVNFAQGYKSLSTNILELLQVYNVSTTKRIWLVYFPLSMPSIMAGLKIAATLSVIGAIVAEFTGAQIGLGRNLFISAIRLEPELMLCSLLLSSVIGVTLFSLMWIIEKKLIKWQ